MAKQFIISAMEETLGEYILNISKDNLKIAALRGQIKLENVQLDGDLVGSHVLGAVGLSSFGVLSCSAKSIKVSIPWKNLEKEPTRFEIKGVHLVCVPLTPSTANQMYGAGTLVDPRCTLRTRAKRLVLARFERNFWNGQMPGEGPVMKRIQRAVKDVERDRKRSTVKSRRHNKGTTTAANAEETEIEDLIDNLVNTIEDSSNGGSDRSPELDDASSFPNQDLPELPRDWKVRLREKVLRNMEAIFEDLHIRLEVPEWGLEVSGVDSSQASPGRSCAGLGTKFAGERAFALGFTLESLVIRTANEKWEAGSHEKRNHVGGLAIPLAKDHLGPNEYVAFNNKIGYFNKLSIYWDDDPPILLSETDALQGNYRKLSADKLLSRVAGAMEALSLSQDPGTAIRQSLSAKAPSDSHADRSHSFICESLNAEVRVRTSDRMLPGPISCSADMLPFNFTFNVRPIQYLQYHKLKAAVKSQLRFDTMPRQRPLESPIENPSSWWKYAIACVTSRPNSRPWQDVQRIGRCRDRYIDLVVKKNSDRACGTGFHAGLSSRQSTDLLSMEDSLPIEALLSFQLVALRLVFESQQRHNSPRCNSSSDIPPGSSKAKNVGSGRFRILRTNANSSKKVSKESSSGPTGTASLALAQSPHIPSRVSIENRDASSTMSLLEAMTLRLGKKVWLVDWKLHDATISTVFLRARTPILQFILRASGNLKSFGLGKRDFSFAFSQCDVFHGIDKVLFFGSAERDGIAEEDIEAEDFAETLDVDSDRIASLVLMSTGGVRRLGGPDLLTPSTFLELPPSGTVCRVAAGKNQDTFKMSLSAHPATLVWTTTLSDSISDFFADNGSGFQTDLTQHIRNAATPLARKAQLALLSPTSLALHLNIASPKVWVPLISDNSEGSLFLDAGTLRMASTKDEGETEIQWNVQARDIGANFVRGVNSSKFDCEPNVLICLREVAPIGRGETAVLRPFSIAASSRILREVASNEDVPFVDPIRSVEVIISPICLNLVDAEMLARLLGKLYARGMNRVQRPVLLTDSTSERIGTTTSADLQVFEDFRRSELPSILIVKIEKVEMALEGHSKQKTASGSDERSVASLDTALQEYSPPTRAYLVEVFHISLKQSRLGHTEITRLSVADASIVRLKDVSMYTPLRIRRDLIDSENCILVRALDCSIDEPDAHQQSPPKGEANLHSDVFRASLLHNRVAHLDEVEVDIDAVILRVTPTTLKDCAKAFRRIAELTQLVTKEMERKVHEEGRKARRARDGDGSQIGSVAASQLDRPASPAFSEAMTDATGLERRSPSSSFDSSILFRLTLTESTLIAGRPTISIQKSPAELESALFAVVQIVSNVLVMFQSIENPDATGSKTLHVSVDNLSALVNTEFERVSPAHTPLVVEPTGAEFRIVYATENFGCVVSQDVSLDCDSVKSRLTPNDMTIIINIARTMYERLRAFGIQHGAECDGGRNTFPSLIRYSKKGTGIATRVRSEIQTFSFVLLRAYKSDCGAPDFLDFNIKLVKGLFDGCMSALSGECSALFAVNSFNSEVSDWEYTVEPFLLNLGVEQMPNELILNISPANPVQFNVTGILLRDFAKMLFDISRDRPIGDSRDAAVLAPSVLSTVGLRRATVARSLSISNSTGLDIQIVPGAADFGPNATVVRSNATILLDGAQTDGLSDDDISLSLRIDESAVETVGERQPVLSIPIKSSCNHSALYLLKPSTSFSVLQPGRTELLRLLNGRASPESMLSDGLVLDMAYYNAEPVVEWCMQYQRLKPSITDVFSIPKGRDLLSSNVWSPQDDHVDDESQNASEYFGHAALVESDGPETAAGVSLRRVADTAAASALAATNSNWSRPYLKNDSPEWSDMTCMLSLARERVMLPDSKWIWVNDWTVDLNGRLGEETDADGWSYEVDFETFSKTPRNYNRGDACRRRRWTRTRMVRPPRFEDALRQLKFVWETSKDENGCFSVLVRSHVRIKNATASTLTFFVYTPSWDEDKLVGTSKARTNVHVPVACASAVYMRIAMAKNAGVREPDSLVDCVCSDRFSIVPTSHTSSSYIRTFIDLEDVSGTSLHFLVEVRSENGILDIIVEPVFRVVNLLPCKLECRVGQVCRTSYSHGDDALVPRQMQQKGVTKTESLTIQCGKDGAFTAVNPWRKPHLALRVPGYRWTSWKRIVNRKVDPTWRPSEIEEEWHFSSKGDSEYADELKTLFRFERLGAVGDPLVVIVSIAYGHCPTIRVYSQYWIVDETGFGCRFSEGFTDLLGTIPDPLTSRRSHLSKEAYQGTEMEADMKIPGHHWSIGSCGMSLYFSQRETLALVIEAEIDRSSGKAISIKSKWISPLDISNVIPKQIFYVDELNGQRRFELVIHVTLCPGQFARTKMISLLPRFQIINLLHREIVIAQDGCLDAETIIPSQTSISFHWEKSSLPPKVRLGAPSAEERARGNYERCWTNGRFQLDRVGITSLRLPTTNTLAKVPMVVQAEVRLATKDQPSAVVIVLWSGSDKSNPLYTLQNRTRHTILCRQPLQDEDNNMIGSDGELANIETSSGQDSGSSGFECGAEIGPLIRSFLGLNRIDEFVWVLKPGEITCFGFDDPEKPHILEWTYVNSRESQFDKRRKNAFLEVDAMGSSSSLTHPGGPQVRCQIRAEHSTKVIEFVEIGVSGRSKGPLICVPAMDSLRQEGLNFREILNNDGQTLGEKDDLTEDDEAVTFSIRIDVPVLSISVVDNADRKVNGREILLGQCEKLFLAFSQTRDGYHEYEARMMTFQVDNHVRKSIHPVLIFCPRIDNQEPFLHMSAVRRLQLHSHTFVFRYAAIRLLEVEIYLDRRTAETIAKFIQPLMMLWDNANEESPDWVFALTSKMERYSSRDDRRTPRDLEKLIHMANSGRIYFEQLHLHPVRLGLTFTQEWMDVTGGSDTVMVFQFIRGMASIANAPLMFTSFVVGHVFESPHALFRVITTHYSSQLTKQVFGILGSLAILGAPADFISNVGNGVKDFLYEPLQGAVIGPREFLEGLEVGTQSLARGVFVGVVRGAANVADAVNSNLAGLTADDDFIDERKAHQRMLTDAMSRSATSRTFEESLNLAYASVARGLKSGALGIVEQPAIYASKHGPVGFLKGVGKAIVGAVIKPVIGLGDGAVLVMNHMSDATSNKQIFPKIPKRLRRALPSRSVDSPNAVRLEPYDERAAKAQKIITGGETVEDVYLGHVNIASHLIIASEQCLWAIDRRSREPWCVSWEEISHFGAVEGGVRIVIFSQTGLKTFTFQVENPRSVAKFHQLLSMQLRLMANVSELNSSLLNAEPESFSRHRIPGVRARQVNHIFGSWNNSRKRIGSEVNDEVDLVEQCHNRIRSMDSSSSTFFKSLDEEAWSLVTSWGQLFSGLSSRRCVVSSIINGTGNPIQIKSTKLVEGGSPCYSLATGEYDAEQGILHAGGVIIFFGWGVVPNLLQAGSVFMHIETNAFVSNMADEKNNSTDATAMPGYQVGFLEKSYDDSGWWAKFWLLVRSDT